MSDVDQKELMIQRHQARLELLAPCITDIERTCTMMFSDIYYKPFSELHRKIFDLINAGYKKIAIAAPRGIGKTSIARTVAMRAILFKLVEFIVYVGNNATFAEMQTENIKRDLLTNKFIRKHFKSIKPTKHEMEETFAKSAWVANNYSFILPRGQGQAVRGINFRNRRPQLIIVDDLEDKKEIKNPTNRANTKEWFYSDLLKSIDRYSDNYQVIYIDTIKHPDALIMDLLNADDWASIILSICTEDLKSLAPEYMTDEEVMEEYQSHKQKGQLDVFAMEYMNQPIAKDSAVFKEQYFKYYTEQDEDFLNEKAKGNIESIVLVDPAKSTNLKSADSAIVGVGVNTMTNKVYVRDIVHGKFHPDELYDNIFNMCKRINARVVGIEVNSLHEFITYPFKTEMNRRGVFYEVIDLKPKKGSREYMDQNEGKEARVAQLAPFYRQGQVYHNPSNCSALEMQLLAFPRPYRWDIMDALAYIVQVLDEGLRYFMPQVMSEDYDSEAEYAELEGYKEPPIEGNWRTI